MNCLRLLVPSIAVLLSSALANAQSWDWPTTPIAGTGFSAPGHAGAIFGSVNKDFGLHNGIVTFSGKTVATYGGVVFSDGIWQYKNGVVQQLAFDGYAIGNTTSVVFGPGNTVCNDAGDIVFTDIGSNGGPGINVIPFGGAPTQIVGKAGVNSTPPGMTGQGWSIFGAPAINSAGCVAFGSTTAGGSGGSGVWTNAYGNGVQPLALSGAAIAGTPYTYSSVGTAVAMNGTTIAHSAVLSDGASTYTCLVIHTPTTDRITAIQKQSVPDQPAYTFNNTPLYLSVNAMGQVAFRCTLSPYVLGSFIDDGSTTRSILPFGAPAPGVPGNTFTSLNSPILNDSGAYVFGAGINGGSGLWASDPGGVVRLIAKTGDAPPGVPGGYVFNAFNAGASYAISDNGLVAFNADLMIPATNTHAHALYMEDPNTGQLDLIAYTGETFCTGLSPTDAQTIYAITLAPGTDRYVEGNSLVYELQFGSSTGPTEIFVTTVPEPTTLAVLAPAMVLLLRRRSK